MRRQNILGVVLQAFLVMAVVSIPAAMVIDELSARPALAQQQPPAPQPEPANPPAQPPTEVQVDVDADTDSGWAISPVWLVVGGIGLLALIAILFAASRGGNATVIKT